MDLDYIKQLDSENVIQNYARYNVAFNQGSGSLLYDTEGREYIDFASGIGVISVGHANPHWVKAVSEQAGRLAHVSNLFYTEPYVVLADRLTDLSAMKAVFFANSGAEANEGAIKIARKYSNDKYGDDRFVIITLNQSFHGRTMATLTATGQPAHHKYFYPFVEGFRYIPPNDIKALNDALDDKVCAVMLEGIQGEGGVNPLDREYLKELVEIISERDVLLILDEVQTGIGRTGDMFCYQGLDINPDIVTLAKGLGGGLPIAAVLVNDKCRDTLSHGTHGTTYGGNLICCAAANAVLDIVSEPGFLDQVTIKGNRIIEAIKGWNNPLIVEVRGKGLMIGIQLKDIEPKKVVAELLERGLITLTAGTDVLRLLPPLTITEEEIDKGLEILRVYLKEKNSGR
ncbi:MAG: aspartate aminotransferase family protein [Clostridiales bacterium]|jgi:acetylornithine/N-succinyldiaminopimelate aminotransferase|nr:aspartate aminotransferase family protein [Clostridiales bacterium]